MASLSRVKVALLLIITLTLLAACGGAGGQAAPGVPIALPYSLGEIPPLEFVLQRDGDRTLLQALCRGQGRWQSIRVDVTTPNGSSASSGVAPEPRGCTSAEEPAFQAWLFKQEDLEPGQELHIAVHVALSQTEASSTERTFQVGPERQLYLADGAR